MVPQGIAYHLDRGSLAITMSSSAKPVALSWRYRWLMQACRPLLLGYFWWRGRQDKGYREGWAERAGHIDLPAHWSKPIVVHCASVGEAIAAKPFITQLAQQHPDTPLLITTFTPTGKRTILRQFANCEFTHRLLCVYLPLDYSGAVKRFMARVQPRLVVLMETELWPALLAQLQQADIPSLLINARLSARSARGYRQHQQWLGQPWQRLSAICVQDEVSARRIAALGVPGERIFVSGNLKQDIELDPALASSAQAWREQLQRPVWVAGSTHAGEDEIILAAFRQLQAQLPEVLLVIVPRHPERFERVAEQLQTQQWAFERWSQCSNSINSGRSVKDSTAVVLGDTMGDLQWWYAASDVAFVGGSLIERGGHNPLEVIVADTALISGPHVFNFAQVYAQIEQQQGVRWCHDATQLTATVVELLSHDAKRAEQCQHASTVISSARGATLRMVTCANHLLTDPISVEALARESWAQHSVEDSLAMKTMTPNKNTVIWYDESQVNDVPQMQWFEPEYWAQQGKVSGKAKGRSSAYFIATSPSAWLLRHYYRGGLVGKINKDRFKREPIDQSRAMAEFALLQRMRQLQLPVPEPIAARFEKAPWWGYRADILVKVIPGATDVFTSLQQQPLTTEQWRELGATIKQLHQAGIYHSDLNCHNLMIDSTQKVWIVDFDKCEERDAGAWQQANLARLLRSLVKEKNKASAAGTSFYCFAAEAAETQPLSTAAAELNADWQTLLNGYAGV